MPDFVKAFGDNLAATLDGGVKTLAVLPAADVETAAFVRAGNDNLAANDNGDGTKTLLFVDAEDADAFVRLWGDNLAAKANADGTKTLAILFDTPDTPAFVRAMGENLLCNDNGDGTKTLVAADSEDADTSVRLFGDLLAAVAVTGGFTLAASGGAASVYVSTAGDDGTGERNNPALPFATVAAAIAAASPSDTISIGAGTFASPGTVTKDRLRFVGAGQPDFDDDDTPTQLVGGTILQGTLFLNCNGVSASDFGVDCGSAFLGDGAAQEGFLWGGADAANLKTGCTAARITALCKARNSAVHASKMENGSNATFSDFKTMYSFYGGVIKVADGEYVRLTASHHSAAGVVLKADAGQVNEGQRLTDAVIDDVDIGVILYNNGGTLADVTVDGVTLTGAAGGFVDNQSTAQIGGTLTVRDFTAEIDSGSGLGIDLSNTECDEAVVEDFDLDGTGSSGTVGLRIGGGVARVTVRRGVIAAFANLSVLNYCPDARLEESVSMPSGGNIQNVDDDGAVLTNVSRAITGGRAVTGTVTMDPPITYAPPSGAVWAVASANDYFAPDAGHLNLVSAGDGIRFITEQVGEGWYEQSGGSSRPVARVSAGKWYAEFSGSPQQFLFASSGAPVGSADRTIALAFRPTSLAATYSLFYYGTADFNKAVFVLLGTDGSISVSQYGASVASAGGLVSVGTWYTAVVTVSSSTWTIYLNGSQVATGSMTTNTVGDTITLGLDGVSQFTTADIARAAVWDSALAGASLTAADAWAAGGF